MPLMLKKTTTKISQPNVYINKIYSYIKKCTAIKATTFTNRTHVQKKKMKFSRIIFLVYFHKNNF